MRKAIWHTALLASQVYLASQVSLPASLIAQQCTTQSQMQPAERDTLVQSATALAGLVQSNDSAALKQRTIPQVAQEFAGIAEAVTTTAPHLQGATLQPSSVWILDASKNAAAQDTQFFCNLNRSQADTNFSIPALPPGRYALTVVDAVRGSSPWQLAMLLRQSSTGTWQLAGFFPRATTAAGHDGLWYWTDARTAAGKRQNWTAWIEYNEAERLLKPVGFVGSSHLDQLHEEQGKAAPPALSNGISPDAPLVVKAKDGTEYQLTALGPDDSLGGDRIDVAMHYKADPLSDPVAARARNQKAASALVAAYPDLREHFHGVWAFAESGNAAPFASEEAMARLQ